MAAKTWDADFRCDAIAASLATLPEEARDDPFATDVSFCLPAQSRPNAGLTPGKLMLLALFVGFGLLAAGAVVLSMSENGTLPPSPIWLPLGAVCSLLGIATFFLAVKYDWLATRYLIGERLDRTLEHAGDAVRVTGELGPPGENQTISISSDDHVLMYCDRANQRLLIEGINARYQIRREDIQAIRRFEFMSYLGAEIEYRIDDATVLGIAVARNTLLRELIRQAPILFFLKRFVRNVVLDELHRTFDDDPCG